MNRKQILTLVISVIILSVTFCQAAQSTKPGLIGVQYGKENFENPQSVSVIHALDNTWDQQNNYGNQWSAKWQGSITAPVDGQVDFMIEATNETRLEIDGKLVARSGKKSKTGSMTMVKGRQYPVLLSFDDGTADCSFKVSWSWQGQSFVSISQKHLCYSAALDADMQKTLLELQQGQAAEEIDDKQERTRQSKELAAKKRFSHPPKVNALSPKKASNPNPGVTLKNVSRDVILSWTTGSEAAFHDLYLGTELEQLENATTSSKSYKGMLKKDQVSFAPGQLDEGTYYYWRVDEISESGVIKGDVWKFRTKGGSLVLQIDLAVKTCDMKGLYPGLAKPGWTIWAANAWTDMYMHDFQVFPRKLDGSLDRAGIEGSGVTLWISTGSEGQLGIGAKGVCRDNLGGGGCPSGVAQGDPIANSWAYGVDWVGPYAGDILLVISGLPVGVYELHSYHNFWEPCKQSTRNCLDCVCGMPPMPSITANPLPKRMNDKNQDRSDNILKGYRANPPSGTGKGVTANKNAYNVAPQHVYRDEELVPSVIKFATDGSEVLVIYQADRSEPLYPDCARKGREGARGILNAFEIIEITE